MERMISNLRSCGECSACCQGHLLGKAYGNYFGNGRKCVFLVKEACTIYHDRPETCQRYQCAWTQHLVPEWMRPDKTGVMISVQVDPEGRQYLKVMEMRDDIDTRAYQEIEKFCQEQNTYFEKVPYENRNS